LLFRPIRPFKSDSCARGALPAREVGDLKPRDVADLGHDTERTTAPTPGITWIALYPVFRHLVVDVGFEHGDSGVEDLDQLLRDSTRVR